MNLKRHIQVELKQSPLPTDDEVMAARREHFKELLGSANIPVHERDRLLASELVRETGITVDSQSETALLIARMYRFALEHMLKPQMRSLDEELGEQTPERSPSGERRSRPDEGRGRRSGGRGGHGRGRDR
jgi:hypothetical protein